MSEGAPDHIEELFRVMVESVKDYAIVALDESGRVASWNTGAATLFGHTEAEILGQPTAVLFTPEDVDRGMPERELEGAVREGRFRAERMQMRRDGSSFWTSTVTTPIRDGTGKPCGFVRIVCDRTERKHLEDELHRRELVFTTLVENIPDIISRFDRDLRCIYTSPAVVAALGLPPEAFVGKTHAEMGLPRETYTMMDEALRRVFETGGKESIEFTLVSPEGTRYYEAYAVAERSTEGSIETVLAVSRDITKRRCAEEALRESEERLRASQRAAKAATWDWNLLTNDVVWTESFYDLFGADPGAGPPTYATWLASVHPDDREKVDRETLAGVVSGAKTRLEYRILKNGEVRWLESAGQVVTYEHGRPARMTGIAVDVSDRKRAEADREELFAREQQTRAAAEKANRLKDEFLATVSHELRTPLNSMLGWLGLLSTGNLDAERTAQAIETIERNARAQAQLVEDLLDVSRIITGKIRLEVRPIDPASFIDAAVEAVSPAADAKGVRLQKVIDTGVTAVSGDPARLQQVVWNLLSNAVKFTPRDGLVRVQLERVQSHMELTVSDTGVGISPEFLPFVFDRFRQADGTSTRRHGGLGLGLAIVRHLVEIHGGAVEAYSAGEGQGTTFVVKLPLLSVYERAEDGERVRGVGDAERPRFPHRLDGLKALVVDDEADTRELLRVALERCGADVATTGSATEALEAFEGLRPHVLISDIGMPDEDGYELIRRVRALPPERGGATPAVALTAYARAEDRVRVLTAGYQMYIAKPVELEELIAAVASVVGRLASP